MLKIEPVEEVVTKRKLIVEMDEDEIAKILVDARPFQKMLRQEKSKWNRGRSTWTSNGQHSTAMRAKVAAARKTTEKKSGKGRVAPGNGVKCPKCHRVFKAMGRHLSACTGDKDPFASVRVPSALDE